MAQIFTVIDRSDSSSHGYPPVDYSDEVPLEQPRSPIARSWQLGSATMSRRSKRAAINRWRQERDRPTHQFVGVLRHTERADAAWDSSDFWTQSEDFEAWPHDPPLSDKGLKAAKQIGQQIRCEVEKAGTLLHIIVCSPFLRCVQTAVEVCCELGADTRLLIDTTLCEVLSSNIMGSLDLRRTSNLVRPIEEILDLCRKRGVACECYCVGQWPEAPETLRSARRRFAMRFLTYLKRSLIVRRNFLIVSHADCVGAALSMMPSESGAMLDKVDYGGMFLAQRPILQRSRPRRATCPARLDIPEPFSPCSSSDENVDCTLKTPPGSPRIDCHSNAASDAFAQPSHDDDDAEPPKDTDGWHVTSFNISRVCTDHSGGALERRLNDLVVDGPFSRVLIEQLLHVNLSDHPLSADDPSSLFSSDPSAWLSSDPSRFSDRDSVTTGNSTLLFGKTVGSYLDLTQIPSDKSGKKLESLSIDKNIKKSAPSTCTQDGVVELAEEKQTDMVDESGSPKKTVPSKAFGEAFSFDSAKSKLFQRRKTTS